MKSDAVLLMVVLSHTALCWLIHTPTHPGCASVKLQVICYWIWSDKDMRVKELAPAPVSCSVPYRTGSWPHVAQRGADWPSVMWLHVSEAMRLFCLTKMLLYIFCCSSLRESFTLPLFSPPSLQETRIKSRTNYHSIYEKSYIKVLAGFVWGCSALFIFLGLF